MKILIWQGHGDIDVYDISSIEKIQAVKDELLDVADSNQLEGLSPDMGIARLVQKINQQKMDVDSFEHLEIKELK